MQRGMPLWAFAQQAALLTWLLELAGEEGGQAAELLAHHGAVALDLGCSPELWQRGSSAKGG